MADDALYNPNPVAEQQAFQQQLHADQDGTTWAANQAYSRQAEAQAAASAKASDAANKARNAWKPASPIAKKHGKVTP